EVARRFLEKEAVGAAELQKLSLATEAANEIDAAGELAAQHRLGPAIVGIAIGMAAGKIVLGVVGSGIEGGRFGAAETAAIALQNIATVDVKAQQMRRCGSASRAGAGDRRIGAAGVDRVDLRCVDLRYVDWRCVHLFAMPAPRQGS